MLDTSWYPTGTLPAVEVQWSHTEFVNAVIPETVVLKMDHARRLNKRGETATSYYPDDTEVVTTSTIRDNRLALIPWEDEYEIIKQFEPAYHIPTDESVYEVDSPKERTENIIQCIHGALWMADKFEGDAFDTEIIPLIKGLSEIERGICYGVFDNPDMDINGEFVAYYATQYYTGGQGARTDELLEDIWSIHDEYDTNILLLGVLSPNVLEKMPPSVVAASGQNAWRSRTKPRKQSTAEIQHEYKSLSEEVKTALTTNSDWNTDENDQNPEDNQQKGTTMSPTPNVKGD